MINTPIVPITLSLESTFYKDSLNDTTSTETIHDKHIVNSINVECIDSNTILIYTIIMILTLVFITIHNKINDTYRS